MANEFKVRKGLIVQGSGSNIFDVQGSQGQLFSVTDSLSGSLFSVNDISGIPIMEVFSDNTIKMGTFNQEAIIISGSRTGMGIATPQAELHISGASNDSLFRIQSPSVASIMFVSGSGNVGIGTTTPFRALEIVNSSTPQLRIRDGVSGANLDLQSDGSGQARITWGSNGYVAAEASALRVNGQGSVGLWLETNAATKPVEIKPNGTTRLIVSASGNVGIGTTTPTTTLNVNGTTFLQGGQTTVRGSGATSATTAFRVENSAATARLTILDDGTSAFNTNHLYVSSSGRVGIGTATPSYTLDTVGNVRLTNAASQLIIDNATYSELNYGTSNYFRADGSAATIRGPVIIFLSASTETMRINSSGNVGIGTTTPTNTLQVVGGITATSITSSLLGTASVAVTAQTASFLPTGTYSITSSWATNALTASFVNTTSTNAFVQNGNSFGTTALLGTNDNQNLQLETSGSVRVHIGNNGNVGIGTTSPTERLHVSGNIYTEDNLIIPSGKDIMIRDVVDDTTGTIIRGTYDRSGTDPNFDYVSTSSIFLAGLTNTRIDLFGTNTTYLGGLPNFGRMLFTIPNSGNALFSSPSNANILFVSGSGRVGIKTTTPLYDLAVAGNISIQSSGFLDFGNGNTRIVDLGVVSGQGYPLTFQTFGPIGTGTSNNIVEKMRLTGSGSLGLGTTSPSARFHISGGFTDGNLMRVQSSTGAEYFFISGSGNVGIGTTTPTSLLQVAGRVTSTELYVTNGNAIYTTNGSVGIGTSGPTSTNRLQVRGSGATSTTTALRVENSAATARLTILDDGTSAFNTNHLYVSSSGRVGVGTATPNATLDVNGNTIITGSITNTSNITTLGSVVTPSQTISVGNGWGNSSGTTNLLNIAGNLVPTATAVINSLAITSTVSQSVNPTTIIRGILVSPTFNTLGPQYRGFEWNNNQGFGLYGVGAAPNYLSGSLGIGITSPSASLHISGANADNLLRVSSPSATNALFVSGSGNVGIGTTTPTTTLNVNGTTLLQGGQTTVRGSGATSATTTLRVENSNQDPELTVLDNGNVGISTATPSDLLTINSPSSTGSLRLTHLSEIETLRATSFHSGLYIGNNIYYNGSGDPVTNSSYAVDSGSNNRGGNLLLIRANNGTTALGGFYFYTAPSSSIANTTATLNESFRITPSSSFFTNTRVGIGAAANTSYAFDVASSAPNAGAARINGNNTVWVFDQASQVTRGTTSLARMFLVQMGPVNASSGTQTALTVSQSISQSSTAGYTTLVVNANETGTGSGNKLLQAWQFNGTDRTVINNSGSLGIGIATPSASLHISGANNANLLRVSSPSASAALFISGSGNVGVGTATPAGLIDIFQGGNSRILVTTDNGFVGLQQSSPAERIHITSDPVNGKYLQIDAGQTSNAPRQVVDSPATAIIGYAAGDSTVYLSEPRWWMEIKLDGNIVLIPCYQPDV